MSLRYKLIRGSIRLMGIRKMFSLPEKELYQKIQKENEKRGFRMPKDKKAHYEDLLIGQQDHCLIIQLEERKAEKAILFLFGGGYLLGPDGMDIATARKLGKGSGSDVWFPYYPLCTKVHIATTYDMVLECYRQMLRFYAPENISFVGASSGAALAIGLLLHNNALGRPLPVPRQVIAVSPGAVPLTSVEREKMSILDKKDVMVTAAFMETVQALLEKGASTPSYMVSGVTGDFTGLPKIYFYYGTDEILYAEAGPFAEACQKYDVPFQMTIGRGMFHCYALMPFFPEGKKAFQEIVQLLGD